MPTTAACFFCSSSSSSSNNHLNISNKPSQECSFTQIKLSCCQMTHTHAFLLLPFLLFLWSSTQILHSAEGSRPLTKHLKISKGGIGSDEEMATAEAKIGSRPPRCEGMCSYCGRCEAVQVPLLPLEKEKRRKDSIMLTSIADDTSNYKPMNWKCKCGDVIFNP